MGKPITTQNKENGSLFESMFKARAQINGMLCEKNHLTARYLPGGRVKVVKSELDYRVVTQDGKVGYFDCKTLSGHSFTYSMIDEAQLERSVTHNYWRVPSGFIVWFRSSNQIVFYKGADIKLKGAGCSFEATDGRLLGRIENFDLKLIMAV